MMGVSASSPEAAQKAIASEIAKAEQTAAADDAAEAKREADIVAKAKPEISNIKLNAACDELKSKMVACTKDEVDAEAHLKDLRVIAEEPADEQADSCKEELAALGNIKGILRMIASASFAEVDAGLGG